MKDKLRKFSAKIIHDGESIPMLEIGKDIYRLQKFNDGKWMALEDDELLAILDAEVDVALVERLRKRAAQEREIAKNSARVAELLAPELVLFKAREGHHNIYATRMAIDHRDSAKKDDAFADDLETAADKLNAALQPKVQP